MFKLVVLSCLVSVALAGVISHPVHYAQVKTVVEPHVSVVETPTVSHVGSVVKNIPTGVSHHSSSVVHSHANIVEPIYAHGVEKSVISTPIVKSVVEHVPVAAPIHIAKIAVAQPIVAKAAYVHSPVAYAAPAVSYASAYSHPTAHAYSAYPAAHAAYSAYPSVHAGHAAYSAYPAAHAGHAAYSAYPAAHAGHAAYSALPYAHHW